MPKLSIIVPAYNEERTIIQILQKVAEQNFGFWEKEIIVINDASSDSTEEKLKPFLGQIRYLKHQTNLGKGAAIKTGLGEVSGETVIIQDADLEYDPADIQSLLDELDRGADVIFGSRNLRPDRRGYSHYVWGVNFLTWLVNIFFGTRLTDVYTCYKLFRTDVIKKINIESRGFELEMELTVKTLKMGCQIKEVPIHYYPRKFREGKKIRAKDGLKGIWTLAKNLLGMRRDV